ncbi:hypothetical protein PCLA_02r0418 [Pseudomonas citronellolis]|nr:hypothetical protein PCLA_02r0418 [Pseudomonas citronellolis]
MAFHRLTKGTRPRGRNKRHQHTRCGALHQAQPQKSLGSRVRGNDGGGDRSEGSGFANEATAPPV